MSSVFELLHNSNNDREFVKNAVFAYSAITGKAITNNLYSIFGRLLKLYGRKGVISSLYTLDTAIATGSFELKGNIYPFLAYGAKKAFEEDMSTKQNYQSLDNLAKSLRRKK